MRLRHLLFFILLAFLTVSALNAAPTWSKQMGQISEITLLFQKAQSKEQFASYDGARTAYIEVLNLSNKLISQDLLDQDMIWELMPYTFASAFRLGVITPQCIQGSGLDLYKQIQMYSETQNQIDQLLSSLGTMQVERNIKLQQHHYFLIYFARAYNKIAWAQSLIQGNTWKKYMVYLPADAVTMIDKSIEDLRQFLKFYKVDLSDDEKLVDQEFLNSQKLSAQVTVDQLESVLKSNGIDQKIMQLCLGIKSSDHLKEELKKKLVDLYFNKAFNAYLSYRLDRHQRLFEDVRLITSYPEYETSPKAKEFLQVLIELKAILDS